MYFGTVLCKFYILSLLAVLGGSLINYFLHCYNNHSLWLFYRPCDSATQRELTHVASLSDCYRALCTHAHTSTHTYMCNKFILMHIVAYFHYLLMPCGHYTSDFLLIALFPASRRGHIYACGSPEVEKIPSKM